MRFLSFKRCILSSKILSLDYELSHSVNVGSFRPTKCSLNTILNRRPHCNYRQVCSCVGSGIDPVVSLEPDGDGDENADATRPGLDVHFNRSTAIIDRRHMQHLFHTRPRNSLLHHQQIHGGGSAINFSQSVRNFSSNSNDGNDRVRVKPVFVAVPNPIRAIRNFVYSWLIRGYFDKEFSMAEFTEGAKQAVSVVSQKISEGNFEALVGLLSQKTIDEVKETYKSLGLKERGSLGIEMEDILHVVPYNVAVHYDKSGGKFLNILMRFWCLSFNTGENEAGIVGFKVGQPPPGMSEEQFKNMGKVFTCTFEFHRDVSTDDDPNWTITQVTLGKLLNTSSDGFPGEELE